MNPQHREFFIKQRALCVEHRAWIGSARDEDLLISVGEGHYKIRGVSPYCLGIGVSEIVTHSIEADEEPQP